MFLQNTGYFFPGWLTIQASLKQAFKTNVEAIEVLDFYIENNVVGRPNQGFLRSITFFLPLQVF